MFRPRLEPSELSREAILTNQRFLIVEGESDRRFFEGWFNHNGMGERVFVMAIDRVEVDEQELVRRDLRMGSNRSRVICLARMIDASDFVRCVIDRDCGQGLDQEDQLPLLVTDYPAIESYFLAEPVLRQANLLYLKDSLPDPPTLISELSRPLHQLFHVRRREEDLPRPSYAKGFIKGGRGLTSFDVWSAVVVRPFPLEDIDILGPAFDVRSVAYGHDIAALILAAYGNPLKNRAQIKSEENLERVLLACLATSKILRDEPLFVHLAEWAGVTEDSNAKHD